MRGKPRRWCCGMFEYRITPADAGKTCVRAHSGVTGRDHPRGCGENCNCFQCSKFHIGSPPRMRGKRFRTHTHIPTCRITPADAGKTKRFGQFRLLFEDHPRGCGENRLTQRHNQRYRGSPPRMRGKPQTALCRICQRRITPADAGKTRRMGTAQADL